MAALASTFNLTALGDRLFSERRLLSLAGKIRRAGDLHSLSTDLVLALKCLDTLEEFFEASDSLGPFQSEDAKLATQSALLNNALVLYARATITTSKQRGGFDLRSRFCEEGRIAHKELVDLRDCAIAHFGSGGSYAGEWQAELVILQCQGEDTRVGFVTRRQIVDRQLVLRARKQIDLALSLMQQLGKEKFREVTEEINKAVIEDPSFYKEVSRHPLNLDIFLTSGEAGDVARSSFEQGHATGIVRHR